MDNQIIQLNPLSSGEKLRSYMKDLRTDEIPEELEDLIEKQPNLLIRAHYGKTSLLGYAVITNNYPLTFNLIQLGADPTWAPEPEWSPLELALKPAYFQPDLLIQLIEGSNALKKPTTEILGMILGLDTKHAHLLHQLILNRYSNVITSFMYERFKDRFGRTPLMYAVALGVISLIPHFKGLGYSEEDRDFRGWTTLHYIAYWSSTVPLEILNLNEYNVNATNNLGQTPLHIAAMRGDHLLTEALIEYGADINAVDKKGYTPLVYALKSMNNQLVDELLDMGANPNLPPYAVKTILQIAAETDKRMYYGYPTVVKLLEYGADPTLEDRYGRNILKLAKEDKKLKKILE